MKYHLKEQMKFTVALVILLALNFTLWHLSIYGYELIQPSKHPWVNAVITTSWVGLSVVMLLLAFVTLVFVCDYILNWMDIARGRKPSSTIE